MDEMLRLKTIYQDRWRLHGPSPVSLGWTKGKQSIRFDALLAGLDCEGRAFLDVGCGFGDLNTALRARARSYRYHGIDMVPEFIDHARELYGSPSTTFAVSDLCSDVSGEVFDYAIGIGIFGFKFAEHDNYRYIESTLARMFARCSEAAAVDFLSSHVTFQRDANFYADPSRVIAIASKFSRRVVLRHDYLPFEFGVTLFKDDRFDKDAAVFLEATNAR